MNTCEACTFYSFKVKGTDWSEGKCFLRHDSDGIVAWVKGSDICEHWKEFVQDRRGT